MAALQETPRPAAQWHSAALEELESGHFEEALRSLRRAVEIDPRAWRAWNDLGVVLEALGNRRDAIYCYGQALRAAPDAEEPRRNLMLLALGLSLARSLEMAPPRRNRALLATAR
ncbi:MAG: hypothetical protein KatS3mg004_2630 [Bryobacteraceae bacterium]|nr:MAG: hypothetical protein KatS3mg004_2630 [Bryobacteraceae bacterium]